MNDSDELVWQSPDGIRLTERGMQAAEAWAEVFDLWGFLEADYMLWNVAGGIVRGD